MSTPRAPDTPHLRAFTVPSRNHDHPNSHPAIPTPCWWPIMWTADDVAFLEEVKATYPPFKTGCKHEAWLALARRFNTREGVSHRMNLGGARARYARMLEEFVATGREDEDGPAAAQALELLQTLHDRYGLMADAGRAAGGGWGGGMLPFVG